MDLLPEMLATHLNRSRVSAVLLRPPLIPRLSRFGGNGRWLTSDRIINRFWDYPRWLRARTSTSDVFHVIDHSYAHLARALPAGRVVVTCHDTDAFRPLVFDTDRGSKLPLFLVRRILDGLQRAAIIACVSETTRSELVEWGLVPRDRTEVVLNGVHECFSPHPDVASDRVAASLIGPAEHVDLLHVGSTISRKRIDLLLRVLKEVSAVVPSVRLLRVGGSLSAAQQRMACELDVERRIVTLPFITREVLAAVYRRAALVLLPSEREGFGLPLIEAMASGTPVVATALPVLREVGGPAACYAPLGDVAAWRETVTSLLAERAADDEAWQARRARCVRHSAVFSWTRYATGMEALYARLSGVPCAEGASAVAHR